jgi:hypothetical protein
MADAVIIDDGGSTRIKQLKGNEADGKMDDLISEKTDQAKGTFATLRVVFFDADGNPHGPLDRNLNANDRIVIQSGNKQKVIGLLNGAKKLSISLESDDPDNLESLVDAKQHKQQRRYVVSNAGRILKVKINNAAAVFDFDNNAEHGTSVYTMVILN